MEGIDTPVPYAISLKSNPLKEMLYVSMKSKVSYIHQQHILFTLFHENRFFLEMKFWLPEMFPKIIPKKMI